MPREAFKWTILDLKGINPLTCKSNIYHDVDDQGGGYLIDIIVEEEEDHMRCKGEVREICPLDFDYEGPTIFDPG